MERAVFLDRDGTIIEDVGYLDDCSKIKFLPRVSDAIKLLNKNGFKTIIVTNQAGIAKGYFSEDKLKDINRSTLESLAAQGAFIDKIYYCPHHIEGTVEKYKKDCHWRKPNPGMIEEAASEYNINLMNSFMIGDKISDMEAGNRAGCRTIFLTGEKRFNAGDDIPRIDYIAPDLYGAVKWLITAEQPKR